MVQRKNLLLSTGCPKKKYLSEISESEMHMENLDRLGPCQIILDHFYTLDHFGLFGPFWTVLDRLDHFGPFGPFWTVWTILTILDHFAPFWTVWTILDCFDHFGPFGQFWTVLTILDRFGP